jgi:alpha-tubulin suppressor-like RCC1 family protein
MPEIKFKTGSQAPWVVPYPMRVAGLSDVIAVAAGGSHSLALLADGTVMAWGHGNFGLGRKGFKPDGPHPIPAPVPGVSGIRALACGESHMLALTNAGTIVSWGTDLVGEVGHRKQLPTPIPSLKGVRYVAADVARSLATLADGTIMAWGKVPKATTTEPRPFVASGLKNPL